MGSERVIHLERHLDPKHSTVATSCQAAAIQALAWLKL
jgi:hypothetical protein